MQQWLTRWRTFLLVSVVVALAWVGVIDSYAEDYINASLVTSSVSFGLARLFNATVSVLSTVTLNVPIVGSIQIGEMLDPLNDLVEDFSTIMKYAISSLLIQKFLVEIFQTLYFNVFISVSGGLYLLCYYLSLSGLVVIYRVFLFACLCKFSIALVALASSWVDSAFVESRIAQNNLALEAFPVSPDQLDQSLDLTAELQAQAALDLQQEKQKHDALLVQLSLLRDALAELNEEKAMLSEQKAKLTGEEGAFNSLFNRSDALKAIQTELDQLNDEIRIQRISLADLSDQERESADEMASLTERMNGEMSTFESLTSGFSRVTMAAKSKILGYVDSLNASMDRFLNLMALFLLKTLVMPLLFLWGVYKAFVKVWEITPRQAVERMKTSLNRINK
ncbi:hypothetical protein [Marinomonas posidonica]|uniref:Uncharacterized protein n=1 Tax=Marinomonas posidonica (strain CECT 7376 / NCIMB 14433 / IVIA-Po-181) TaxID=491952 RepID=F6CWU1_MARPP|nr:hypothetical protein [Marinomonas posidonica]AEF55503.1 hypothetical protein Mar181_2470 [Marinomonas posidonica IVIA-Po-181]